MIFVFFVEVNVIFWLLMLLQDDNDVMFVMLGNSIERVVDVVFMVFEVIKFRKSK